MEIIVLHLKLVRAVRRVPLVFMVRQNIEVVHISHGWHACLNLDKEVIASVHTVKTRSNLKKTQD